MIRKGYEKYDNEKLKYFQHVKTWNIKFPACSVQSQKAIFEFQNDHADSIKRALKLVLFQNTIRYFKRLITKMKANRVIMRI